MLREIVGTRGTIDETAAARLAQLSDAQRDVLALVARHESSKAIARRLGISPHTVDQRMKRVQAILGVEGRFAAARLYTDVYGNAAEPRTYDGLVYQSPELAAFGAAGRSDLPTGDRDQPDGGYALHQPQAAYADGIVWQGKRSWTAVLLEAGRRNEMSATMRTVCIVGIALTAILGLAAAVSLVEGLSRIF